MNIGILGLGLISDRIINGISHAKDAKLYAVCSRDESKAIKYKRKYDVDVCYSDYETFYRDENIDLVYICTYNKGHYEHIKACLENHKHVICEKPMLNSIEEIHEVFDLARENNVFLMEAHKTCFTPLNTLIKEKINNGVIGNIKHLYAEFSYESLKMHDPKYWLFNKDNGGGACYDCGVYPVCYATFMMDKDIQSIHATNIGKDGYNCNFMMNIEITYTDGSIAQCMTSWLYTPKDKGKAVIVGEDGCIETPAFWKSTKATINGEEIEVEMESDFTPEIEHAIFCIKQGLVESPIMGRKQSVMIMKIINALYE